MHNMFTHSQYVHLGKEAHPEKRKKMVRLPHKFFRDKKYGGALCMIVLETLQVSAGSLMHVHMFVLHPSLMHVHMFVLHPSLMHVHMFVLHPRKTRASFKPVTALSHASK